MSTKSNGVIKKVAPKKERVKKTTNLPAPVINEIGEDILPESLVNALGFDSLPIIEADAIINGEVNLSVAVDGSLQVAGSLDIEGSLQDLQPGEENSQGVINVEDRDNVLLSKRFIKGVVSFPSPGEILTPCLELLRTAGGRLSLVGEKEEKNANNDGTLNVSFGRLNLISSFDIDEEMKYEVGVLIAYDLGKPSIKIYRGARVSACTNLCVFGSEDTVKFDIGSGVNMECVQNFIKDLVLKIEAVRQLVRRLKMIHIPDYAVSNYVGAMLMEVVEKKLACGTNSILRAVDLFSDDKGKYYYRQEDFNAWKLYNGFTEYFGEKVNFFDIPEKTRDTFKLVEKYCL